MYLRSNLEYLLKIKDSNAYRLQIEANIPQPTIQRILTGKTDNPRQETLKNLSAWSGFSIGDLLDKDLKAQDQKAETFPRPASDEDFAFIPFYNANGSCGNGYSNDHVEIKKTLAFHKDWLKANALTESKLSVITAKGDSMSPTITDGAILLINGGYGRVENGKVYAIVINDEVRIKRLFIGISGDCRISSDNANKTLYPDETISADTLSSLHIIGRVVWTGGML